MKEQETAVPARMALGDPAAIRIHRKWPAGSCALSADERTALAVSTEAQCLQRHYNGDSKRIVNLGYIDISRGQASHSEGIASRSNGSLVRSQIGHIRNSIVRVRLAVSKHPDGPLARVACSFGGSNNDAP